MPDHLHVASYSIVSHYSKAVLAKLHELPVDDVYTHGGTVQANGALNCNWHVLRSKTPQTARNDWDVAEVVKSVPAAQAVLAPAETGCRQAA